MKQKWADQQWLQLQQVRCGIMNDLVTLGLLVSSFLAWHQLQPQFSLNKQMLQWNGLFLGCLGGFLVLGLLASLGKQQKSSGKFPVWFVIEVESYGAVLFCSVYAIYAVTSLSFSLNDPLLGTTVVFVAVYGLIKLAQHFLGDQAELLETNK